MQKLIIKYYFQTGPDQQYNHLLLKNEQVTNIKQLKQLMLKHNLIQTTNYLRFKDFLGDQLSWVDIKNENSPLPINNKNQILIKILQVPYKISQKQQQPRSPKKQKPIKQTSIKKPSNIQPEIKENLEDLRNIDFIDQHFEQPKQQENEFLDMSLPVYTKQDQTTHHYELKNQQASFYEPKVIKWAYQNNIRKDVRTLLSTIDTLLWDGFYQWPSCSLGEILDEKVLKMKVRKAQRTFHLDKYKGVQLTPGQIYLMERIFSEINDSYKDYKLKHN